MSIRFNLRDRLTGEKINVDAPDRKDTKGQRALRVAIMARTIVGLKMREKG